MKKLLSFKIFFQKYSRNISPKAITISQKASGCCSCILFTPTYMSMLHDLYVKDYFYVPFEFFSPIKNYFLKT